MQAVQQGYLWKKGKVSGKWVRRWYALEDGILQYSEEAGVYSAAAPAGSATQANASGVQRREALQGVPVLRCQPLPPQPFDDGKVQRTMLGLRIFTADGGSKDLYTTCRREWECWARSIKRRTIQSLDEYYDVIELIGAGAFSTVHKARNSTSGEMVALKVIDKKAYTKCASLLDREITVLHLLDNHPSIVQLIEVIATPHEVVVSMELCDGGNLVEGMVKQPYTETAVANIIRQVAEGLEYLHSRCIVHRDLKPENIVFKSKFPCESIRIVDFGMSSFFNQGTVVSGTPHYMAPEIIRFPHIVAEKGCGPGVDMWALGCLAFFMLTGSTPFKGNTNEEVFSSVLSGKWDFTAEQKEDLSANAVKLVKSLLCMDETMRPSANEVTQNLWTVGATSRDTLLTAASESVTEMRSSALKRTNSSRLRDSISQIQPNVSIFSEASAEEVVKFASKQLGSSLHHHVASRLQEERRQSAESTQPLQGTSPPSQGGFVGCCGIFMRRPSTKYRKDSLDNLSELDDWTAHPPELDDDDMTPIRKKANKVLSDSRVARSESR